MVCPVVCRCGGEGVRVMVDSLLAAMPSLLNVMLLYFLTLFFFGLIGLFLFHGRYRQQCFSAQPVYDNTPDQSIVAAALAACPDTFTCVSKPLDDNNATWIQLDGTPCSLISWYGFQCPTDQGFTCQELAQNPNFGVTSFDNIGIAFITIIQQMSLEGWTDNMFVMEKAMSRWYVSRLCCWALLSPFLLVALFCGGHSPVCCVVCRMATTD